jgi:cyclophilin family peptidyl-prolyl cis-trans isomerase
MAPKAKKRALQTVQKRQKRGTLYLAVALVIIIGVAVGLYVYVASLPPGPPDFTISAPTGVTIHAGTPIASTINVTAVNRFDGTVRLSAAGSTGLTTSVTPANVTGSGTATLTMSASTNGTYTVTVTGTSGGLTHSVTPRVDTPVYATLVTSNGTITVELYRAQTPSTVANFVNLADSGFYTNLTWHRIIPGFVIQTGDPKTKNGGGDRNTWGQGSSSQSVPFEYDSSLHNDVAYLGMASTGAGAGGTSQFYINVNNNSASLDGKYAVFGKVIVGMNVVNTLANTPTTNQYPNAQNQPVNPFAAMLVRVTISSS